MTTYPDALDSDLELPRVEPEVSEISGDYINSVRDAVIAIQTTIGINPQGNKSSLVDRINISIDQNGYIKASALENIGLVTLPIVNRHVGPTAGIQESKLALDYSTRSLKTITDSMKVDLNGLATGLATLTNTVNQHLLGQSFFHDGYSIAVNRGTQIGIAGLRSTNIGDAVNEISSYLFGGNIDIVPHLELDLDGYIKHIAENISVDASNFILIDRGVKNVQEALDSLDSSSGALGGTHIDQFHSNGILKEINASGFYNSNQQILYSIGVSYTKDTSVITFDNISSLSVYAIKPGDIIYIMPLVGSAVVDTGVYQVRAVGPLAATDTLGALPVLTSNQLAVFHTFVETRIASENIPVKIYKPASLSSEQCPLACTVRNSETIVDTISVLEPQAARVLSIGFNGSIINQDGYSIGINVGIGNGLYRNIVIPNLNKERLATSQSVPVDSHSVAERINAYVSHLAYAAHFPITAYRIGNELAIAHNWVGPDYTLEIVDGYSGNYALGLDAYGANVVGKVIYGNETNNYTLNGFVRNGLSTIFDGYCDIAANSGTLLLQYSDGTYLNPLDLNIVGGSVLHVIDHPIADANGSYTIMSTTDTFVSLFENIPVSGSAPTRFNVKITSAHVPCTILDNVETQKGVVQVYLDFLGNTQLHQKLTYGSSLGAGVEIINATGNFPAGTYSIVIGLNVNNFDFYLMDGSVVGEITSVHRTFKGAFKLYHPNGIAYLTVQLIPGVVISGAIDTVTVSPSLNSDEAMLLCSAHFNGELNITNVVDERLFGTLGPEQIRDDVIEIYSQRPVADLHSDGVVRGLDLAEMPYFDTVTGMPSLPLRGGVAYVDGVRVAVETQKVIVQAYTSSGTLITSANKVIGINAFGSLQVLNDDLSELLVDGYNADAAFGKILPLYYITITNGGITDVIDIRKFINNVDDKIELIVDATNNVVGNFRTLEGALLYAVKYPAKEKLVVKIVNSVYPEKPVVVPEGVSIIGSSTYGGNNKHQIVNTSISQHDFITLSGSNRIENIEIVNMYSDLGGALLRIVGSNINIDKCLLHFANDVSLSANDIAIYIDQDAAKNIRISDNIISNVYSGIASDYGVENLIIASNKISEICGIGGGGTISYGVRLGTSYRQVQNIIVSDNQIYVPSVVSEADIQGIGVLVGNDIGVLKITRNNIVHAAQNTMTNGIRIANEEDYSGMIDQLFITDNYINGIKLDDNNIYGLYVAAANNVIIKNNTLENIGIYATYKDRISAIKVELTDGFVDITSNTLNNCDVLKGIEIVSQSESNRFNVSNNSLINIGKFAEYIRGNAVGATVSNNLLVGPGEFGIKWYGARTKISGNSLQPPEELDGYSFGDTAIYVTASNIDITDNTILGMNNLFGSVGISNAGSGRNELKITNNTIRGSLMTTGISLYGSSYGHVVTGNRIFNETLSSDASKISTCILVNGITQSLIMGNLMSGQIDYGIWSNSTDVGNLTIVNNSVEIIGTLSYPRMASLVLSGTAVNCFIVGNRFPDGSSSTNIIGDTPSYDVYLNNYSGNIIGINAGLQDTISLHASSGVTAYDSTPDAYTQKVNHWAFKDLNDYWEINTASVSDARRLYFPIFGLPNGAKLTAVRVQGKLYGTNKGNLTGQIFKRSVTNNTNVDAISTLKDMSSATSEFANSISLGKIPVSTSGGEQINYAERNYYVQITHQNSTGTPANPEQIRIYGITIEFTY